MTTLLNLPTIAQASEEVWNKRKQDLPADADLVVWDTAFEAGFLRALTVLGMGSTSLTGIQIEHIATTYFGISGEDYAKDPDARPHSWVLQAMAAVAHIYENADTTDALLSVVNRALDRNEVCTVSLHPLPPLRMGNYQHVIDVRAFNAQTPPGPWADRQTPDDGSVKTALETP